VVLSFPYAERRFGDITQAAGQSVLINDVPFTVAGVAAPEFFGVNPAAFPDLYIPLRADAALDQVFNDSRQKYSEPNFYWIQIMGRLHEGKTREQAQSALAPMFQQFVGSTASTDRERKDLPALLVKEGAGGLDALRRRYSQPLLIMMTLVG